MHGLVVCNASPAAHADQQAKQESQHNVFLCLKVQQESCHQETNGSNRTSGTTFCLAYGNTVQKQVLRLVATMPTAA
jgi:hypothetical protein